MCSLTAHAERRVALVIGNAAYAHMTPLNNPGNDAADVAASLKRLGFDVLLKRDLGKHAMRDALEEFSDMSAGADLGLVFFAGHGMALNKTNYLLPVDADLETDRKVKFQAIGLDAVLTALQDVRGIRLVILDACRSNIFRTPMRITQPGRNVLNRGFHRTEPASGTLVSFSARDGTTAEDGRGRNSPFTAALLDHLEQPGTEIQFMFRQVRDKVLRATGNAQEPHTYGSLPGKRIYLKPPENVAPKVDVAKLREKIAWDIVKDSNNLTLLKTYIADHPDGRFTDKANALIRKLEQQDVEQKRQNVAALPPPQEDTADSSETPEPDRRTLVASLQQELNRVGCDAGTADGKWGKNSRRALQRFSRHGRAKLLSLEPTKANLDEVTAHEARVCPVKCGPRHETRGGKCVLKTCRRGKELNRRGVCVAKLDNQARKKALKCSPRHRIRGNRCVLKTCGRGKELDRRGRCVASRQPVQNNKRQAKKKAGKQCGQCSVWAQVSPGSANDGQTRLLCGARYRRAKIQGRCD